MKQWFKSFFLYTFVLLLSNFFLIMLLVSSSFGRNFLSKQIRFFIENKYAFELSFREVQVDRFFPPRISLSDLILENKEKDWQFSSQNFSFKLQLFRSLFYKKILIHQIQIKKAFFKVKNQNEEKSSLNFDQSSLFFSFLKENFIDIPQELLLTELKVETPFTDFFLNELHAFKSSFFSQYAKIHFHFTLKEQQIRIGAYEQPLQVQSELEMNVEDQKIQFTLFEAQSETSSLKLSRMGSFAYLGSHRQWLFNLPLNFHINLEQMSFLKDNFQGIIKGQNFFRASLQPEKGLKLMSDLQIQWENLILDNFKLHSGESKGFWSFQELSLTQAKVFIKDPLSKGLSPLVQFDSVQIDFQHATFQASSQFCNLPLTTLLDSLDVEISLDQTDFLFSSKDVSYMGRFDQKTGFEINVLSHVNVEEFYPFGHKEKKWNLGNCSFDLNLFSSEKRLIFHPTKILCKHKSETNSSSSIQVNKGSIAYKSGALTFEFESDQFESQLINHFLERDLFQGPLKFQGNLNNRSGQDLLKSHLLIESESMVYLGQKIRNIKSQLDLSEGLLSFKKLKIHFDSDSLLKSQQLELNFKESSLKGDFLWKGQIKPEYHFLFTQVILTGVIPEARGYFHLSWKEGGKLEIPFLKLSLAPSSFRYEQIWTPQAQGEVIIRNSTLQTMLFQAQWTEGSLNLKKQTTQSDIHLEAHQIPLKDLFVNLIPIQGSFSGDFTIPSDLNWHQIQGEGSLNQLTYYQTFFPHFYLSWNPNQKGSEIQIKNEEHSIFLRSFLFSKKESYLILTLQKYDFFQNLPSVGKIQSSVTARLIFKFHLQDGFKGNWSKAELTGECEELTLSFLEERFEAQVPFHGFWKKGNLIIDQLKLFRQEDFIYLNLFLSKTNNLDLNVESQTKVGPLLTHLFPIFLGTEGKAKLNLMISQVLSKPLINGSLLFDFQQISLQQYQPVFQESELKGEFHNNVLHIKNLSGKKGGGTFESKGQIDFNPFLNYRQDPQPNLTLSFKNLETQIPNQFFQDVFLKASGQVKLTGEARPYTLAGHVNINHFLALSPDYCEEYINPINPKSRLALDRAIQKKEEPWLLFDCQIAAKQNLFLKTNCIDSRLSTNLTLQGNNTDLLLQGEITSGAGEIRLFQSFFNIQSLSLQLNKNDLFIYSQLAANMPPYKIFLDISGSLDAPKINMTSSPKTFADGEPITDQDLMDAILTGRLPTKSQRSVSQTFINVFNTISQSNLLLQRLTKSVTRGLIESLSLNPIFNERSAGLQASLTQKINDELTLGLVFEEGYGYRHLELQSQLFLNPSIGILGTAHFSDDYGLDGSGRINELKGSFEFQFGQ